MFKHAFSFEGRIGRTEFALTYLLYLAGAMVIGFATAGLSEEAGGIVTLICFIPLLWLLCAQGVKRCHDRGNAGWFILIPFYVFWMLFAPGEPGLNEYNRPDELNPEGKQLEDSLVLDSEP